MPKPNKRVADIKALEELKQEYEQQAIANRSCINGIQLSIDKLVELDKGIKHET